MGFVSLPDVEDACRDVEYALDVLKMDGINLQSHTGSRYLGDPDENELYAELDRRHAVIFVHPQRPQVSGMPRYFHPCRLYRAHFRHHARHNQHALHRHAGEISQHPLDHAAHGRRRAVPAVPLERDRRRPKSARQGAGGRAAYLSRFWYDVAQSPSPLALKALLEIADPSRILFGTDYPSARPAEKVMKDTVDGGADLRLRRCAAAGKSRHENAQAILPRFAKLA